MRYAVFVAIAIFLTDSSPASAADWLIKADGSGAAATIQAGIDAASSVPGQDRVVLANGTFTGAGNNNIQLNKPITLTSQNGAANAIIDMQGQRGIVIVAMTGEPTISNITIRNASYLSGNGGGITTTGENPTISGCVISGCVAVFGGGIYIDGGAPIVQNNQITGNHSTTGEGGGICIRNGSTALIDGNTIADNWNDSGFGAGIRAEGSAPTITNNDIHGNDSLLNKGGGIYMGYANGVYTISNNIVYNNRGIYGGGVLIKQSSGGIVNNNTIVDNWCANLGGGLLLEGSTVTVSNTIIAFNTGGPAIFCFDSAPTIECCLTWNPGSDAAFSCQTQNLVQSDPQFCGSTASRNYELQADSPAAAANNPCLQQIGAEDVNCSIVPTLLRDFSARVSASAAHIAWELSEAGAGLRFILVREEKPYAAGTELDASAIVQRDLSFDFVDAGVTPGKTYRYRVDADDEDGRRVLFVTAELTVPTLGTRLYANQPNPFNPTTTIRYDVGVAGRTRLEVYDANGGLVSVLFDGVRDAGPYETTWNGTNRNGTRVASGVYFYRLTTPARSEARKMILIK